MENEDNLYIKHFTTLKEEQENEVYDIWMNNIGKDTYHKKERNIRKEDLNNRKEAILNYCEKEKCDVMMALYSVYKRIKNKYLLCYYETVEFKKYKNKKTNELIRKFEYFDLKKIEQFIENKISINLNANGDIDKEDVFIINKILDILKEKQQIDFKSEEISNFINLDKLNIDFISRIDVDRDEKNLELQIFIYSNNRQKNIQSIADNHSNTSCKIDNFNSLPQIEKQFYYHNKAIESTDIIDYLYSINQEEKEYINEFNNKYKLDFVKELGINYNYTNDSIIEVINNSIDTKFNELAKDNDHVIKLFFCFDVIITILCKYLFDIDLIELSKEKETINVVKYKVYCSLKEELNLIYLFHKDTEVHFDEDAFINSFINYTETGEDYDSSEFRTVEKLNLDDKLIPNFYTELLFIFNRLLARLFWNNKIDSNTYEQKNREINQSIDIIIKEIPTIGDYLNIVDPMDWIYPKYCKLLYDKIHSFEEKKVINIINIEDTKSISNNRLAQISDNAKVLDEDTFPCYKMLGYIKENKLVIQKLKNYIYPMLGNEYKIDLINDEIEFFNEQICCSITEELGKFEKSFSDYQIRQIEKVLYYLRITLSYKKSQKQITYDLINEASQNISYHDILFNILALDKNVDVDKLKKAQNKLIDVQKYNNLIEYSKLFDEFTDPDIKNKTKIEIDESLKYLNIERSNIKKYEKQKINLISEIILLINNVIKQDYSDEETKQTKVLNNVFDINNESIKEVQETPKVNIDIEALNEFFKPHFKTQNLDSPNFYTLINDLRGGLPSYTQNDITAIASIIYYSDKLLSAKKPATFNKWLKAFCSMINKDVPTSKPSGVKKQIEQLKKTFYYLQVK